MKKIFDEINDLRQVINDIDDEKYKNVLSTINNVVNDMALKIKRRCIRCLTVLREADNTCPNEACPKYVPEAEQQENENVQR